MTEKEIKFYIGHIKDYGTKWLEFHPRLSGFTGSTFQFEVWTKGKNYFLGEIKWFGRWRGYAFFPAEKTVFEWDCQRTLADICEKMTKDHRKKYTIKHNLRGEQIKRLAAKVIHTQNALDTANKNAAKDGKLGVLPDSGGPSFRESNGFRKKMKVILEEHM